MAASRRAARTPVAVASAAAVAAILATLWAWGRPQPRSGAPQLDFVLGSPLPGRAPSAAAFPVARPATRLAGPPECHSFLGVAVAALGCLAAARRAGLVVRQQARGDTWVSKQRSNAAYLKRNPPPMLTPRELRKRTTKILLFRRQDEEKCEMHLFIDPRADKYQWSVEKTRIWLDQQATMVDDIKKKKLTSREDVGMPPPAICLYEKAMREIRSSSGQKKQEEAKPAKEEEEEKTPGKKKEKKKAVDLSNIDSEFMAYKGLALSKKQKAAMASRQKKK